MAMPKTGREVHLSHGVEKGAGESGLNDNNQLDLLPCITELPNETVDGTLADQPPQKKKPLLNFFCASLPSI